jgi:hypothetical protein
MENLMPSILLLVSDVRRALEKNLSCQVGIRYFIERDLKDSYSLVVKKWWHTKSSGQISILEVEYKQKLGPAQKMLLVILEKGLAGASIYQHLSTFEQDIFELCDEKIQHHIAILPLKLQIPLMGLILPSIMVLIIVPALQMLTI